MNSRLKGHFATCGHRRPRSACAFVVCEPQSPRSACALAQANLGLHCPPTEINDTVERIEKKTTTKKKQQKNRGHSDLIV